MYMIYASSNSTDDNAATESSLIEIFGSVIKDSNSPFFLGATQHNTNNTGELTAFGEAIIWLISNNWKQLCESISTTLKFFVIHSDSEYAINAIIGTQSGPSNI